ncbi:extracellular solute-binding protein [Shinella daejeonensis]|uniref:extracellular solute-binding protein n=1 Tax=Shinella daejeonensis TaxID=659017 RepID=UPI0020C82A94|nr:extracellular solute-binding protein [Shinella daejeonensis]MCP8896492.1 extracellular solute-binding protein [Shinella daejeonensis]
MMKPYILGAISCSLLALASAANANDRIKFDFWHGLTGQLGEVVERQCALFNGSQTEYEVTCTGQGGYDMAEQNTIAAFRAGEQPTIVQMYEIGTVNFMLSGAIYPANQFAKDHGLDIDWSAYFPGIANYYATSTGEMWSFPYNSSTAVFYWNKDAWAKIGKDHAPQTWDELGADLAAMKEAGIECGFAFDYDAWMNLEQFSAVNALPVATMDNGYGGLGAEVTFHETPFVDHMQRYKDWVDQGFARVQTQQTGKSLVQAFADGTCASMVHTIGNHSVIKDTQVDGLNWDVTLMPVIDVDNRHNSIVGGAALWVLQGKSPEEYKAAAAFLAYVTGAETGERYMVENTGYIPVTLPGFELLKNSGFYEQDRFRGREVAIASLTASDVTPLTRGIRLGNHIAIRNEIRTAMETFLSGKADVKTAVTEAAERSNQTLRRFEQTYRGAELP